jgi:hypothetical protein
MKGQVENTENRRQNCKILDPAVRPQDDIIQLSNRTLDTLQLYAWCYKSGKSTYGSAISFIFQ